MDSERAVSLDVLLAVFARGRSWDGDKIHGDEVRMEIIMTGTGWGMRMGMETE